ncbi:MAG TPA: tyrosine-type recombinase/integrase [Candidatus Binatia bacterium]|nr:tyrosine-type recombinase/integrase [Candidatus Binatia bacterium]
MLRGIPQASVEVDSYGANQQPKRQESHCNLRAGFCRLRPSRLLSIPKSRSHITHGEHKGEPRYDPAQHQQYWGSAWDSLTKAAGLGGIRFHDLRHTFITHMVERGVPPRNDSGICGAHESENAQALHAYHVRRCASHCETVGRRSHPHTREAGKRKGIPCVSYTAFGEDFAGSTMSGNM